MFTKRWAGNINYEVVSLSCCKATPCAQFQWIDYFNLTIAGFPLLVLRKWDWLDHAVSQWDFFLLGFIFTYAKGKQPVVKRQRTFSILHHNHANAE